MAPLRPSTTKSEYLPDDPTGFVPSRLWKLPSITTWDDSRNQNHPTDSAEEAQNLPEKEKHKKHSAPSRWSGPSRTRHKEIEQSLPELAPVRQDSRRRRIADPERVGLICS